MFLLVSVCCDTAIASVFLLVLVCCDTALALVFLLVFLPVLSHSPNHSSDCGDDDQALALIHIESAHKRVN